MLPLDMNSPFTQHQSLQSDSCVQGFFGVFLVLLKNWNKKLIRYHIIEEILELLTVNWGRLWFYLPQLVEQQSSNVYSSEYKAKEVLLYPVQGRKRNTCFRLQERCV